MRIPRLCTAFLVLLLGTISSCGGPGDAAGSRPAVAFLHSYGGPGPVDDVVAKLAGTGRFSFVTSIEVGGSTPSLDALIPYAAVLLWVAGEI